MDTLSNDPESRSPGVRLQKLLASAGVDSRRKCEQLILDGRVTVDGQPVQELGTRVDPDQQRVMLDGELIRPERMKYFVLNKPRGYLCTTYDPSGRKRALDLIPDDDSRLFTVGRLDENSQGLLLVTNDGELAQQLAHPRYEVPKKYRVQVAGKPTPETLHELRRGVRLAEAKVRPESVRRTKTQGNSTFLEIVISEGRNREIRRMLAAMGHKVMSLERIQFGPLSLGSLPVGHSRRLNSAEVKQLKGFGKGERTATRTVSRGTGTKRTAPKKAVRRRSPASRAASSPSPRDKSKRPKRTR